MKFYRLIILTFVFILLSSIHAGAFVKNGAFKYNPGRHSAIVIDLTEMNLYLIDNKTNKILKTYPVAGGKSTTPSPVGSWRIITKAARWGAGFGSRWMQLSVPWGKFGIHGTNKPYSIGGAASEGCIRMFNSDINQLYELVDYGTPVRVYGGPPGLMYFALRDHIPGDRGADIYEVQKFMKQKGYYPLEPDGLYGEEMKKYVIKFRRDMGLEITHDIDKQFYNALGVKPFD